MTARTRKSDIDLRDDPVEFGVPRAHDSKFAVRCVQYAQELRTNPNVPSKQGARFGGGDKVLHRPGRNEARRLNRKPQGYKAPPKVTA